MVPPSIHPTTGQPYRGELHEPAILPYRLCEQMTPPPKPICRAGLTGNASGDGLIRTVAEAEEGGRHDALVWAAGCAVNDGILDQIEEQLIAASLIAEAGANLHRSQPNRLDRQALDLASGRR